MLPEASVRRVPLSRIVSTLALAAVVPAAPSLLHAQATLPAGTVPSRENPRMHEVVARVSAERIERDIRTLVGFGTRHTLSDTVSTTRGIGAARRWIFDEFTRISQACGGCLEVSYQSGIVPGEEGSRIPVDTRVVNVVAVLRGMTDPDRYVIHTGDIDDRVSDPNDFTSDNPGANDNASGMAAVLEDARVLSRYPTDLSIAFVGLSGEEQGLHGGEILAEHAIAEGWEIEAVINNDMVGNIEGIAGVIENTTARVFAPGLHPDTPREELNRILRTGGELDTPARQLARYIDKAADMYVPNLDVEIIYRLDRYGRGGHHTPFFLAGFPASVRLMEAHEHYERQHQTLRVEDGISYGDVLSGVNFEYAAKMTALDAVSIGSLGWAPASPDSVTIAGAVQASPTLRWSPVSAPDLLGYRVYWRRPTDPNWTFSRFVGNVTEHTVENVIIDNWFFGVAAVDREGNESLVVFPTPES
jgi:hypothetical protein